MRTDTGVPEHSLPAALIKFLGVLTLLFMSTGCGLLSDDEPAVSEGATLEDVKFRAERSARASESTSGSGGRGGASDQNRPNIVLVSVDDLDLQTAQSLPRLQGVMADEGVSFENAFVSNPLCCPSRATTLKGQYAHNTSVQGNRPPQGGYEKFHRLGREKSTVATWLDEAGYNTAYMGKYMNGYNGTNVPPGWDEWLAVSGNYASDALTYNGRLLPGALQGRHETDVLSGKSSLYIERAAKSESPFFLYLAPRAPHQPARPAPRHRDLYSGQEVPAQPSDDPAYNEADVSDKPPWLAQRQPLNQQQKLRMDELHRDRLRSMASVEEMMVGLEEKLRKTGELDDTYIVFTSDNGHHMGQHRLPIGKWTAYEEDIRVPLMIRGPGVPEGQSREHMVLNNDLAPTFADLGGARRPEFVDGRSIAPLLRQAPPPTQDWRDAFLIEAAAFVPGTGAGIPIGRPRFEAVRSEDHLYVEYASGARELYDLRTDPHQLENLLSPGDPAAAPEVVERLEGRLDELRGCSAASCRDAEQRDKRALEESM